MKRLSLFFLLIFSVSVASAVIVRIGIFTNIQSTSIVVLPSTGNYDVYGDGKKITVLQQNTFLQFSTENSRIQIKNFNRSFGAYTTVKLIATDNSNGFKIKSVSPGSETLDFDDDLEVTANGRFLKTVNIAELEHYVEGTVEAEIGKIPGIEFLKVQAIICRTYTLNNLKRHQHDGYNLCNQVHCQVYKGKSKFNPLVQSAVIMTQGKIIVDKSFKPIMAVFHSNCGGQTRNSENVWSKSLPYLRSVIDTFCNSQPHATWEKYIAVSDWENYLTLFSRQQAGKKDKKEKGFSGNERLTASAIESTTYDYYPSLVQQYYPYKGEKIPMQSLRDDWNLKSTYFFMIAMRDSLLVKGRGYGHGVGLCQEGAAKMAEYGFLYEDIINFYYKEVAVVELKMLE